MTMKKTGPFYLPPSALQKNRRIYNWNDKQNRAGRQRCSEPSNRLIHLSTCVTQRLLGRTSGYFHFATAESQTTAARCSAQFFSSENDDTTFLLACSGGGCCCAFIFIRFERNIIISGVVVADWATIERENVLLSPARPHFNRSIPDGVGHFHRPSRRSAGHFHFLSERHGRFCQLAR